MALPYAEPSAAPIGAAALALLLLVLVTDTAAQSRERLWTVTCGLPQENNELVVPMHTGPFPGGSRDGHLMVKKLHRRHPEGGLSTEMWLLSRSVGWWKLKAIRVHPDDQSKFSGNLAKDMSRLRRREVRQIIDSPFLSRAAIIRAFDTDAEGMVDGQILALLPDASRLRCAQRSDGPDAARVAAAQRALAHYGHDPGPVDGRMGPRTRAALRAFQTERGLAPHGQLDAATFERLTAP